MKKESVFSLFDQLEGEQIVSFNACMHYALGHGKHPFLIFGANAGTGKTFTINALRHFLDLNNISHTAIAYTGRAAARIRAQTVHSLLYEPVIDEAGDLIRFEEIPLQILGDKAGQLIIVDEGSMIPRNMHDSLAKIGVPIIYVGDYAQLPPINADSSDDFNAMFSLANAEHTSLVDMRRFSPDSGIGKIAKVLRDDNRLMKLKKDDVAVIPKTKVFDIQFYIDNRIDMVACGMNKTRKRINDVMRRAYGYEETMPEVGETVVCLRNDVINGVRINNGELYTVVFSTEVSDEYGTLMLVETETEKTVTVNVKHECWTSEYSSKQWRGKKMSMFTYGYALTVHKLQGSTVGRLVYVDEDVSFFTDQQKFRYTGVTRAAEMLWLAV
jgi:exodeoxyribonuclease-5